MAILLVRLGIVGTFPLAVVIIMNPGGARNSGFIYAQRSIEGNGNISGGEAYTVQPLGISLVTMNLAGAQPYPATRLAQSILMITSSGKGLTEA